MLFPVIILAGTIHVCNGEPMKLKTCVFAVVVTAVLSSAVYADSPLTSTKFGDAYLDEPVVAAAVEVRAY